MSAFDGKVAIVTGAGRRMGLGEAIARRLAADGAAVVVSDIGRARDRTTPAGMLGSREEMESIAADIRDAGGTASTRVCDVREEGQVAALVRHAVKSYGRLDIFVNNAGIGYVMKLVTELDQDEWDTVLDVNLRGCFFGIKHAARQMIKQGKGGRIVNVAGQAAKKGFPYAAAYTSSKHALIGLVRSTAIELGPHGITVNNVCPNHVSTALGAWQSTFFADRWGMSLEQYLAEMKARIPMGRPGLPEDTANAVAFLCSEEAGYITAESMNVSGGEETH
ncbi:MAG: SDR family NAD(P)-dependent oxidoreductase [Alphaproteobacteria bacterium]